MKLGFSKGIILEQNKEPALSRSIKQLSGLVVSVENIETPVSPTPELLAPHEIILIAKEAKIIDETDGKKLWKKLSAASRDGVTTIVADALDDEPYISSQLAPALQFSQDMAEGLALAKRAIGASKSKVEVYRNMFDLNTRIPWKLSGVRVMRIGGKYPAEGRYAKMKRKNENIIVIGVCALIHLRRAVYEGRKQTSTFITVAGDCAANPANYEVPLGCSMMQVLNAVGLIANPKRIVAGGAMTGFGITDPDMYFVSATTRGILAFADEFRDMGYSCIGCGRCTQSCPVGLSPYFIYGIMQTRQKKNLPIADAELCIGCGICSYVCPSKLDLAQAIAKASYLSRQQQGGKQ